MNLLNLILIIFFLKNIFHYVKSYFKIFDNFCNNIHVTVKNLNKNIFEQIYHLAKIEAVYLKFEARIKGILIEISETGVSKGM